MFITDGGADQPSTSASLTSSIIDPTGISSLQGDTSQASIGMDQQQSHASNVSNNDATISESIMIDLSEAVNETVPKEAK